MLDGEVSEGVATVWGIPIPITPDDRRRWPGAIRAMAVKHIAAGAKIRDIVAKAGAHKSLVAKWARAERSTSVRTPPPLSRCSRLIRTGRTQVAIMTRA